MQKKILKAMLVMIKALIKEETWNPDKFRLEDIQDAIEEAISSNS